MNLVNWDRVYPNSKLMTESGDVLFIGDAIGIYNFLRTSTLTGRFLIVSPSHHRAMTYHHPVYIQPPSSPADVPNHILSLFNQ